MPSDHPALTAHDVLAHSGWPAQYARVLAVASDGDYGFALVDGNGDGAELEAEIWLWHDDAWTDGGSSGAGSLSTLDSVRAAQHADDACYAYGSAPGRRSITLTLDGHRYDVPVGEQGVWAFVKIHASPGSSALPQGLTSR
jgi:hypothetical protein